MNIEYTFQFNDRDQILFSRDRIATFLFTHLEEYGDEKGAILKCIAYAYGDNPGQDGFVLIAHQENEILGVVIVNDTNMAGYIPEHILVYIAVHGEARGKGVGKALMEKALNETEGDVALHVEPENPADFFMRNSALRINILK